MKAAIELQESGPKTYVVHFDRPVPALPLRRRPHGSRKGPLGIDRTIDLDQAARAMSELNEGRYPIELADPFGCYRELLGDLAFRTRGLIEISSESPYAWEFRIGRFFEAEKVGRRIIARVRRRCFPRSKVEIQLVSPAATGSSPDWASELTKIAEEL